MKKRTILRNVFLTAFFGIIFPPSILLIWGGKSRDFVIVLVVFVLLVGLARPYSFIAVLLAIFFAMRYRAEGPNTDLDSGVNV